MKKQIRLLTLMMFLLLVGWFNCVNAAVQVVIDPANFTGQWHITGVTGYLSGIQTFDLDEGSYNVVITGSDSFSFAVAADGTISTDKIDSATFSGNTLTFKTMPVTIDPADFSGESYLSRVTQYFSVPTTVNLVPGLSYNIQVAGTGSLRFAVAADGTISTDKIDSATFSGNTLTFKTMPVTIDPADFSGRSYLNRVTSALWSDPITVNLVPGMSYSMRPGFADSFRFTVAGDGTISVDNGVSAVGGDGILIFNTTPVLIDPADFSGDSYLERITSSLSEPVTVNLVPGISYLMKPGHVGQFRFTVAGDGTVSVANGDSAVGGAGTLTFNTLPIWVTPDTDTVYYISRVISGTSEPTVVHLVPGIEYSLKSGGEESRFSVTEPCGVIPSNLVLASTTFSFDCGSPDSDEDGVPDDTDNCPAISNPQQLDQDLDSIGDFCDLDLDGDDIDNGVDNCPDVSNVDQLDSDGDGFGDVCDNDGDGDAVPDVDDNCPLTPNTDQANSDGDLMGDACDADDDNDGIEDLLDNCPLDSNEEQYDYDDNGQGDVCDGDIDGDGLPNQDDFCPRSPVGQLVNVNGCTGAQFIIYSCLREDYVQHGQYVNCVAHAAKEAVDQGLLSPKEKALFVKEAAKKK